MTFTQLQALVGSPGASVSICRDSRRVGKGDVFVAICGGEVDGHDFIDGAVENGASYIVSERPLECCGAEVIVVQSCTEALGLLAQQRYGTPAAKLTNLAVTGTNGKTTVSYLVRSIIEAAGKKCGLIGTIVYDTGANSQDAPLTTPDALDIARMGAEMLSSGAEYMVIEASSHALSQDRLAGVDFTAAAFTNLTGDHLDYHGTAEEYLAAKARLFSGLPAHATSILNAQSPASEEIAMRTRTRKLWYAVDGEADIVAHIDSMDINQTCYRLEFNGIRHDVVTSMPGRHNISNHLAAAGLCLAAGFDIFAVTRGLSALKCVPGRLEPVEGGQDFSVFIDYAHTDDALRNVLSTLKPLCNGHLAVVFGCGGDRDKTKRPRMAKAAQELADRIIVTSDNPRTESPDGIIGNIVAGFGEAGSETITVEPDRREAIRLAIERAGAEDIVLIAGKGHETYQIVGDERLDFDDAKIAQEFLAGLK